MSLYEIKSKAYFENKARANASLILQPPDNALQTQYMYFEYILICPDEGFNTKTLTEIYILNGSIVVGISSLTTNTV